MERVKRNKTKKPLLRVQITWDLVRRIRRKRARTYAWDKIINQIKMQRRQSTADAQADHSIQQHLMVDCKFYLLVWFNY